jgi:hypothetical protein
MTKSAAFGAELKIGVKQVETATIVGTITGAGDATVTITCDGLAGTPLDVAVALAEDDTADMVAAKMADELNDTAAVTALFTASSNGPYLILTRITGAANIADLNIAYTNDDCTGLTPDATSDSTTAGVALTTITQVSNISGPGLAMDTEDVTTHDSTGAFEEVVSTILRSGEVSLDIVYDPAGATHSATAGLLYYLNAKKLVFFDLIFASTYNWTFDGYVTAFEPDIPHDGALTASVTAKITSQPTLE